MIKHEEDKNTFPDNIILIDYLQRLDGQLLRKQ